jgi:hypothetical protein
MMMMMIVLVPRVMEAIWSPTSQVDRIPKEELCGIFIARRRGTYGSLGVGESESDANDANHCLWNHPIPMDDERQNAGPSLASAWHTRCKAVPVVPRPRPRRPRKTQKTISRCFLSAATATTTMQACPVAVLVSIYLIVIRWRLEDKESLWWWAMPLPWLRIDHRFRVT